MPNMYGVMNLYKIKLFKLKKELNNFFSNCFIVSTKKLYNKKKQGQGRKMDIIRNQRV